MQPIWKVGGTALGLVSSLLGEKYVHACTEAIESTIVDHYQEQVKYLKKKKVRSNLKKKIIKFREDELHHKNIAFEEGASKEGFYKVLDGIIKTGSKIAIKISEKY